jgi:hypothetical protein
MRSKYLLMVSPEKWTPSQRERAQILFEMYPDIKTAYSLTHSLKMIFAQRCGREAGRESIKERMRSSTTLLTDLPMLPQNR